jgi:hypothetical protein
MRSLLLALLVCAAGCSFGTGSADLSSLEVALVAGSSIGHAASIAAASMGGATACATVTQACSTDPCSGATSVSLRDACPLPLGGVGSGSVVVGGTWTTPDDATLMMMFGVAIGEDQVALRQAVGVSVKSTSTSTGTGTRTVAYAGQDVMVDSGATLAAQSSWTVSVDDKGTPGDPADDVFTLTGAQQGAGTGQSGQVTLTEVVLDPSCRKNPVSGDAIIQQVGTSSIEQDHVHFHAACDGKADVQGTLGGTHAQKLVLFH